MPFKDATGGYRAYRMTALDKMDLATVASQGYCFQVDLAWRAYRQRLPGGRGADHLRRAGARREQDELLDRPRGAVAGHRLGRAGPAPHGVPGPPVAATGGPGG